jgi:hypothetical protein
MFTVNGLVVLAVGLGLIAAGTLGGVAETREADNSIGSTDVFVHWPIWLAIGGGLLMTACFSWWWVTERGRLPSRPAQSSETTHGGLRLWGAGTLDWVALILLPVGGVVPVLGWLIVMVLLWTSRAWTPTEKLLAALALPGGPLVADVVASSIAAQHWALVAKIVLLVITIPTFLLPTAAAVFLAKRLWQRRFPNQAGIVEASAPCSRV